MFNPMLDNFTPPSSNGAPLETGLFDYISKPVKDLIIQPTGPAAGPIPEPLSRRPDPEPDQEPEPEGATDPPRVSQEKTERSARVITSALDNGNAMACAYYSGMEKFIYKLPAQDKEDIEGIICDYMIAQNYDANPDILMVVAVMAVLSDSWGRAHKHKKERQRTEQAQAQPPASPVPMEAAPIRNKTNEPILQPVESEPYTPKEITRTRFAVNAMNCYLYPDQNGKQGKVKVLPEADQKEPAPDYVLQLLAKGATDQEIRKILQSREIWKQYQ